MSKKYSQTQFLDNLKEAKFIPDEDLSIRKNTMELLEKITEHPIFTYEDIVNLDWDTLSSAEEEIQNLYNGVKSNIVNEMMSVQQAKVNLMNLKSKNTDSDLDFF